VTPPYKDHRLPPGDDCGSYEDNNVEGERTGGSTPKALVAHMDTSMQSFNSKANLKKKGGKRKKK
jgi:hypothetical protein